MYESYQLSHSFFCKKESNKIQLIVLQQLTIHLTCNLSVLHYFNKANHTIKIFMQTIFIITIITDNAI